MKKLSIFLSALLCCGLMFATPLSLGYAEENDFNEGDSSSSGSQELPDESSGDEPSGDEPTELPPPRREAMRGGAECT